jgi:hypothetical protein
VLIKNSRALIIFVVFVLFIELIAIKYLMVLGLLPKVTFMPIDSFNVNIIVMIQ